MHSDRDQEIVRWIGQIGGDQRADVGAAGDLPMRPSGLEPPPGKPRTRPSTLYRKRRCFERCHGSQRDRRRCDLNRRVSRTFDASEWTRTTTRETPDKALNLVQEV